MSTTGDLLPAVYVGDATPKLEDLRSLAGPPYDLLSGQSVYFVGAKSTPFEITVLWESPLGEVYENVDT